MSETQIQPILGNVKIVDLSVITAERWPVGWPTSPAYHTSLYCYYEDVSGPYYSRFLFIEEHHGTHYDAPAHLLAPKDSGLPNVTDGEWLTGDKIPLEQFMGPAAVVDCRSTLGKADLGKSPVVGRDFLEAWEAKHGRFQAGECVLFYTSWTDLYYKPLAEGGRDFIFDPIMLQNKVAWPSPDEGAMGLLVERGVRLVGVDTPTVGLAERMIEPHLVGLKAGMVLVEKLTNLSQLPVRGAAFLFLPLYIEGGGGGPGRAVAFLPASS
jgi:kynurenine formamidase